MGMPERDDIDIIVDRDPDRYLITATLTSLMSNNATAVLLTPIAIQLGIGLGVDPRPFLVAVVFGSSAAFATPIGYQTNTLVFGPGGYYFRDYLRVGLPLTFLTGVVACAVSGRGGARRRF